METAQPLALLILSHLEEHALPVTQTVRPVPGALSTNAAHALPLVLFFRPVDVSLLARGPSF
jgi:hypothetical protein